MRWMVALYDKALVWSKHEHAPYYLALVSFIEASFFPIPPYFMLAPMALAKPKCAPRYALIATVASVLGGIVGYTLGFLIFKPVIWPLLEYFGQTGTYQQILNVFNSHGFMALLILGVTPVPYKLVAIGAGFLMVPLHWFIITSLISRGLKFFVLAMLVKTGGVNMEQFLRAQLEKFGMLIMGILGILLFVSLKVMS